MIKIHAISGVSSIGANMIAYEINSEIIICDMGWNEIEASLGSEGEVSKVYPNLETFEKEASKVKAIVLSSADPTHIGAVSKLASKFNAPIYGTKYTIELLKKTQDVSKLKNKIESLKQNNLFSLLDTKGISVELVNVTYSVPQASMIAIHTKEDGVIIHTGSFKFDNRPAVGMKPNFKRLQELGEKGVSVLSVDALKSNDIHKTMSEILVKEMVRDTFIETDIVDTNGIIITLSVTHMTRLKSIIDLSVESKRKVIVLGDFKSYLEAAKEAGVVEFDTKQIIFEDDQAKILKLLADVQKDKTKYVVICDGSQGEPGKVLHDIVFDKTELKLDKNDKIVFSSSETPHLKLSQFRRAMYSKINEIKCKSFTGMHVSGHATKADIKDLLVMTKPKSIIPTQGDIRTKEGVVEVGEELNYEEGETLFLINDGSSRELK
jgi:ribonuclease J